MNYRCNDYVVKSPSIYSRGKKTTTEYFIFSRREESRPVDRFTTGVIRSPLAMTGSYPRTRRLDGMHGSEKRIGEFGGVGESGR